MIKKLLVQTLLGFVLAIMLTTVTGRLAMAELIGDVRDVPASLSANRVMGVDPHSTPDPAQKRAIIQVHDNLYRFVVGEGLTLHAALFLVTPEGIILTDPTETDAAQWLRDELKRRFNKPVKYVIYSHGHFDHIGGGQVFQKDGAIVIAHENAVEPIIGEKLPTAVPNKVFKKDLRIELGGDVVKLHE